jgi:CoA enzyme activase uncharacterised domain (DUF2229)
MEGAGKRRVIIATCEKGVVQDLDSLREIKAGLESVRAATPNLVDLAAHQVWKSRGPALVCDAIPSRSWRKSVNNRITLMKNRANLRVGIPRILAMYAYAPLFSAYLESLGVLAENIVYSDYTTNEMYRTGSSRGAIDPCFPSKIAIAHFHDLIFMQRVPDRGRNTRNGRGSLYQGDQYFRGKPHSVSPSARESFRQRAVCEADV